jgi:hypothetical protein
MEVVLLWLDDLDDLVFAAVAFWARLRRLCLQIGLFAAVTLAGCELWAMAAEWSLALAGIAACSVAVWMAGALLVLLARRIDLASALARA